MSARSQFCRYSREAHAWSSTSGQRLSRQDQPGAGQDAEDDHNDGGQQPLEQVEPVAQQPQRLAAFDLAGEAEGHQECRDQQEDVDAAGDAAEPDVVGDHHEDREGAEALDLGPVAGFCAHLGTRVRCLRAGRCSLGRHKKPLQAGFQNVNVTEP